MNFDYFCNVTSLHGWQYLGNPSNNRLQKCFWIFVLTAAISVASYFSVNGLIEFKEAYTSTSIHTTTGNLYQVTFPDFVICNINQFQASVAQTIKEKGGQNIKLLKNYYIQGLRENFSSEKFDQLEEMKEILIENYDWTDDSPLQDIVTQSCEDLLIMTKYQDFPRRFFHQTYRSQNDWGHCCEIVPYLDFENPNTTEMNGNDYTDEMWNEIPEGNARSGVRNGLRLLVDVESFEYASSDIGASGVKVAPIGKV